MKFYALMEQGQGHIAEEHVCWEMLWPSLGGKICHSEQNVLTVILISLCLIIYVSNRGLKINSSLAPWMSTWRFSRADQFAHNQAHNQ